MAADQFAAAAIRGTSGGGAIADRMQQLRDAMEHARAGDRTGALQGAGGTDAPRGYTIDIGAGDGPSFADTLKRFVNQVSDSQDAAAEMVQRFVDGEPVELHQVMAKAEEAGISLELLIEMRNKLTEAYRAVMSMQS
ncbi:MAG: Flagellar hook-basal body complex protein FliE [Gemmatimonadaceae bacterium]|nr:Flagellar hook-basal body complex protein FliE [Gemmatimonadaceae bacterium]